MNDNKLSPSCTPSVDFDADGLVGEAVCPITGERFKLYHSSADESPRIFAPESGQCWAIDWGDLIDMARDQWAK
jgi:hypothetical protein